MYVDDRYEQHHTRSAHTHRWRKVSAFRWHCADWPRCLAFCATWDTPTTPPGYTDAQALAIANGEGLSDVFPVPRLPKNWKTGR